MSLDSDLTDRVLHLPDAERAALAHELLQSLDPAAAAIDFDAEWAEEIDRRIQQAERGEVKVIDSDVAIRNAQEFLRSQKTQ